MLKTPVDDHYFDDEIYPYSVGNQHFTDHWFR